jgi:hypothetical protein
MTEKDKADRIWEVSKDVSSYAGFSSVMNLGITIGLNDIPFERLMLYSWIKEGIESGRKN